MTSLAMVLLISLMLSGCIYTYSENYCVKYESFKITCNKEKLQELKKTLNNESLKCSDIISDETINTHLLNEIQFQKCLFR